MKKLRKRFEFDILNTIEAFACICGCQCAACYCGCINITDQYDDEHDDDAAESVYNTQSDNKVELL
ncbi:MAG: CLI_3235 family bacteriocin precursor [Caulobacteraceae bacterium]